MKKIKYVFWILLILLCAFVSTKFYATKEFNALEHALLVIENTIKTFFGNSPLKLSEIMSTKLSDNDLYDKVLVLIYAIVIYISPALLVASVITTLTSVKIKLYEYSFKLSLKFKNNSIIIFGYNDMVENFINNEANKNRKIIVVTSNVLSNDDSINYFKKNVWIVNSNAIASNNDRELDKIFSLINYVKYIFLFDEDALANYTLALSISDYLIKSIHISEKKKIYCYAEDYHAKVMISNYFNNIINNTDNGSKIQIDDYNVFDISSLRARKFFEGENNKVVTNFDKNNIHNVIIGFGNLGHAFFDEIVNRSVYNQNGELRIDIIGNDIDIEKNYILNRISNSYVYCVDDNHYELSNTNERCDGKLNIYFHNASIENKDFYNTLKGIATDSTDGIDNIFICTKVESITIRAINTLEEMKVKHDELFKNNVKLSLRLEHLNKYSNANQLTNQLSKNGFKWEIITTSSEILTMKMIENVENTNIAVVFNYIYSKLSDSIYNILNGSKNSNCFFDFNVINNLKQSLKKGTLEYELLEAKDLWRELDFPKRHATWELVFHNQVKENIMEYKKDSSGKNVYDKNQIKFELLELGKKVFDYNTLKDYIKSTADSKLFDFIKIEHRRWNYSKAFTGFHFDLNGDKNKYQHKCLTTYKKLVENAPDTVLYDLIPMIYLLCDL